MKLSANQNLILIEGAATYERILTDVREVEMDEGIRYIKDFLKIYPDFARAHNDLAVMYYQTGNALKALAHYEKSHKLDPGNVTYRKNLADFYFVELEWTGDAIHTYLDILKDNPFDIETLNALGTISLQIGRREQARQYFSRTLQLESTNREAQQALQQLVPPADAASNSLQISQQSAPPALNPEPPVSRAAATPFRDLFRLSESDVAPRSPVTPPPQNVSSTLAPDPERTADELYREAISLANADNISEAISLLERLLAQDSRHALAHNDLGVLCQKVGDRQKSRHYHEEAVRLEPANRIFQKNLADLLYMEFFEFEEALSIYVRLLAKAPRDIEILKAIAHVSNELGRPEDARFFYERVLGFQPWDREALTALPLLEEANLPRERR